MVPILRATQLVFRFVLCLPFSRHRRAMLRSRLGVSRVPLTAAVFLCFATALYLFLPYDSPIRSALRFNADRTVSYLGTAFRDEQWLFEPPEFPVDLSSDVAWILKTGYGTQHRLPAQLEALGLKQGQGYDEWNALAIADFASDPATGTLNIEIHDVVAAAIESRALRGMADTERIQKYINMTAAIRAGRPDEAKELGQAAGWELDAMKFIPGLELAYRKLPRRKWYLMLDDDTYILKPSLRLVLGHMDPSKSIYLGNAIGDYKARFAHGGSAVLVSQAAMSRLFDQNPRVVEEAYLTSLKETWGDKLVATVFMKVGVYLNEQFSHFFNGEHPWVTQIRPDRFCSPLISFHKLADPAQMAEAGRMFSHVDRPIFWSELWEMLGQLPVADLEPNLARSRQDHVGKTDESTMTTEGISTADKCLALCEWHYRTCLAWTWESDTRACHISPWFIVRGDKPEAKYSGLNVARVKALMDRCTEIELPR